MSHSEAGKLLTQPKHKIVCFVDLTSDCHDQNQVSNVRNMLKLKRNMSINAAGWRLIGFNDSLTLTQGV